MFAWLRIRVLDLIYISSGFLSFLDINFSQEYSVRCACISIKRIHNKVSGRMSESGFFLSQLHRIPVGIRDFQAKSGESRRDGDGWICPLAWPLFHCHGTQHGGRDVTWKRPMYLDTWWHHLATLLDLHTRHWVSLHDDDITLYIKYITVCSVNSVSILWRHNLNCCRNFIKWRHHHDVGFKRRNPFF